ncbi:DnaA N-terminal domain-containing protein [Bacillus sp. Marseille-P3661]|uniref:DnaA N-terminal domain-containing protein n=1 Tax=Bacillus sp. Marseille-P3661 TaxID=1936234 RepID=UPI000C85706D|nr:DnaA N-terminal domain-containing protein [Bacillus sp. Marseille-P3661]
MSELSIYSVVIKNGDTMIFTTDMPEEEIAKIPAARLNQHQFFNYFHGHGYDMELQMIFKPNPQYFSNNTVEEFVVPTKLQKGYYEELVGNQRKEFQEHIKKIEVNPQEKKEQKRENQNGDLWKLVLHEMQKALSKPSFVTWIEGLDGRFEGDTLVISANNSFARDWVETRYVPQISKIVKGMLGQEYDIKVVCPESL